VSIQTALIAGTKRLNEAGIEGAPRDARLLMAHVLGIAPGRLTLVLPDAITAEQAQGFEQAIERRAKREPVSHILGYREFYGRRFSVSADVLDPRPETEVLIAEALSKPFTSVLDLGVGSGAILLTLLAEQVLAKGLGTDVSEVALAVARGNADALGLSSRARFQQADWWDDVEGQFDLITSTPPYIAAEELAALSPELAHEPRVALTDEADGLSCYRIIAAQVRAFLAPRGRVLVEIGPTQGAAVSALFLEQGLKAVRVLSDFDGRDRVVCAQAPNPHPRNSGK